MSLMPGLITENVSSLDYNQVHCSIWDLRADVLSGRYKLTDCGDGILDTGTDFAAFEECDYAKDPSGEGAVTYPHDISQSGSFDYN